VLIVDDHVDTTDVLARLLTQHGHQAREAYTLGEAKKLCAQTGFDVILCDIALPDGDGKDLARMLKASGFTGRLIALTACGLPFEVRAIIAAGFDAHLLKPTTLQSVLATLMEGTAAAR
jgi:CheY-like chemotaxis protein